jgi:hypothetical protein
VIRRLSTLAVAAAVAAAVLAAVLTSQAAPRCVRVPPPPGVHVLIVVENCDSTNP